MIEVGFRLIDAVELIYIIITFCNNEYFFNMTVQLKGFSSQTNIFLFVDVDYETIYYHWYFYSVLTNKTVCVYIYLFVTYNQHCSVFDKTIDNCNLLMLQTGETPEGLAASNGYLDILRCLLTSECNKETRSQVMMCW